jgi:hypothetical protein
MTLFGCAPGWMRLGSSMSRSTVVSVDGSETLMTRDVLAMILIPSSRDDDPFEVCACFDVTWFKCCPGPRWLVLMRVRR